MLFEEEGSAWVLGGFCWGFYLLRCCLKERVLLGVLYRGFNSVCVKERVLRGFCGGSMGGGVIAVLFELEGSWRVL